MILVPACYGLPTEESSLHASLLCFLTNGQGQRGYSFLFVCSYSFNHLRPACEAPFDLQYLPKGLGVGPTKFENDIFSLGPRGVKPPEEIFGCVRVKMPRFCVSKKNLLPPRNNPRLLTSLNHSALPPPTPASPQGAFAAGSQQEPYQG